MQKTASHWADFGVNMTQTRSWQALWDSHTFPLCSLSFWTVVAHTFTAFERCKASHGASFPHKTACFSLSHSFLKSHQRRRPAKRLIHNTNIWPSSQQFTPHLETIKSSSWEKRWECNTAQEVSCERTAPMLVRLRKKTVLWGNRLSTNPLRFLYRGWRAFQDRD